MSMRCRRPEMCLASRAYFTRAEVYETSLREERSFHNRRKYANWIVLFQLSYGTMLSEKTRPGIKVRDCQRRAC
jgi:hypothetical protein